MGTKVYGVSDDLIEFEGDVSGEATIYSSRPSLLMFSDGTILAINYGTNGAALWKIVILKSGPLLITVDRCTEDESDTSPYSDVAHFADGLSFAFHSRDWERVQ